MRAILLSLPVWLHVTLIVGVTIGMAFALANFTGMFFDMHQLKDNTDLISSVYEVMGTIYAILLTFTLWGVWQNYTDADLSVEKEAFALLDLVHMIEASTKWGDVDIRRTAAAYLQEVMNTEWPMMKAVTNSMINFHESNHPRCLGIVKMVQSITPEGAKEVAIFTKALTLLSTWLDARRTRILIARGNSARALWPLLITGAAVLFAFNGLFVAESTGIWATLLGGTSLVIGITFYLIFTLDAPFAGVPCIDSEPFYLVIGLLTAKK